MNSDDPFTKSNINMPIKFIFEQYPNILNSTLILKVSYVESFCHSYYIVRVCMMKDISTYRETDISQIKKILTSGQTNSEHLAEDPNREIPKSP